jgi:hypothetical protein
MAMEGLEMGTTPGRKAEEAGEETTREESAAEVSAADKGHGAEVAGDEASPEEESASGENAGDEEQDNNEGTEEEPPEETEGSEGELETADAEEKHESKGIREMQKRIDTLTARSKGLEEQNAELKQQLEGAHPVLQPTMEDPLSDLNSSQDVVDRMRAMADLREWCIRNWDGGEWQTKDGETRELSASDVRERYVRSSAIVERYGPARIQYLELRNQYDAVARQAYPSLFDANSEDSKIANTFLRQNPGIARLPQYVLIIGDAIVGGRIREERAKQQQAATTGKKPAAASSASGAPKIAPRPIRPAGAKTVRTNGADQLLQRFHETGSEDALTKYLEMTAR